MVHQQSTEMILPNLSLINNEFVEVTSMSMSEGLHIEVLVTLASYIMDLCPPPTIGNN